MAGTWTYRRGGEYLELRLRERDSGVDLVIVAPDKTETRSFDSLDDLLRDHTAIEVKLLAGGWSPQDFFPDRRTGHQRRRERRSAGDRRRRIRAPTGKETLL